MVALVLRFVLGCTFLGHGLLALSSNAAWFRFYEAFGLSVPCARATMPLVGFVDLVVVVLLGLWPALPVLLWCAAWTVFTAALRPIAGDDVGELLVRAMNFGPAVALIIVNRRGSTTVLQTWLVTAMACVVAGALLGGSLWPGNPASALEWTERAGAAGLPLASLLLWRARP